MEQFHIDAPGPFGITMQPVSGQNQIKILTVLLFLKRTDRSCLYPGVITASGNTGYGTEFFGRKGFRALLDRLLDNLKYTGRVVHKQCTYFLVVLSEEIFFKNSTSCFR